MTFKIDCFNAGLSNDVYLLINPLLKDKVAAFNYSYYANDGSRSELWSNALIFESVFADELPITGFNMPDYFNDEITWSLLEFKLNEFPTYWRHQYLSYLNKMKEKFSLFHPLVFFKRYADETEIITFFLNRNDPSMIDYYFNHIYKLGYFIKFFKAAGARLIYQALIHPTINYSEQCTLRTNTPAQFKQIHLNPLSQREQQIGHLLAQGFNTIDIAKTFQLSIRTIESFILQLKKKLECHSRSEVIQAFVAINTL